MLAKPIPITAASVPMWALDKNEWPAPSTGQNIHPTAGRIALPVMEGIVFEYAKDIILLEAHGSYTELTFVDNRKLIVCRPLSAFESQLDGRFFFRIHRSLYINMLRIKMYLRGRGGYVVMDNDEKLRVSKLKRAELMSKIKDVYNYEAPL